MATETPLARHRRIVVAAEETGFVIDRRGLRELGVDRHQARRQVAAGRWVRLGQQTFGVRDAPLTEAGQRWRAVWDVGHRVALVDGVSALQVAGLTGWTEQLVHVSVVHCHDASPVDGVRIHKVIRRTDDELAGWGLPGTRPAVAAILAAHCAVSDRAAATIMAMAVQQRLVSGEHLRQAQRVVRGRTRRAFIHQVVADIADGAHSLNELDFVAACRCRGLPEPARQVVRHTPGGRIYLDVWFEEHQLVIEIDGAGHLWGLSGVNDAIRANDVVVDGDRVLRINVIGRRLNEQAFMDQVAAALRSPWARANAAEYRHRAGGSR